MLKEIVEQYRKELASYQMSKGEWKKYYKIIKEDGYQEMRQPILSSVVGKRLNEYFEDNQIDVKLMATDKAIRHATAGREGGRRQKKGGFNPQRDLTDHEIAQLPKRVADPDLILIENNNDWIFVYSLDKEREARVVFRKNGEHPLQLVTFTKIKRGSTKERGLGKIVYEK